MSSRLVPNPRGIPVHLPGGLPPLTTQAPVTRHLHVGFDSVLANKRETRGEKPISAERAVAFGAWETDSLEFKKGQPVWQPTKSLMACADTITHTLMTQLFVSVLPVLPVAVSDYKISVPCASENGGGASVRGGLSSGHRRSKSSSFQVRPLTC